MIRTTAIVVSSFFMLAKVMAPELLLGVKTETVAVKIPVVYSDNETPFLNADLKYGTITMKSGRVMSNVRFRLNLVSNETECVFANGVSTMLLKGNVKEIAYKDTTAAGTFSYRVRSGYPPFDQQTRDHFYIVLADGRCSFLKSLQKKVTERVNDMTRSVYYEYETFEEYYLSSNGTLKHWRKDKDLVLAELADKQEAVHKFITENQVNFRNAESVAALIGFYNTL